MMAEFKRLESVIGSLQNAVKTSDRLQCYRLSIVVLRLIIEQHRRLENTTDRIKVLNEKLKSTPDTTLKHGEHYRYRSGWGRRSSSNVVGTPGNQLRPLNVMESKPYHAMVTESVMLQLAYNEELTLLQQYANQFKKLREAVIELKPRNEQQRLIQCVLARSQVWTQWNKDEIRQNPVFGCICGRFYESANMVTLTYKLLKTLNDVKGKIGRFSLNHANVLLYKLRNDYTRKREDRYNGKRGKVERSTNVENYVQNSEKYNSLLGWIVGLKSVQQALTILPYAAAWKEQYHAIDRLCRSIAVRKASYVKTLFTSQPVECGTIRHLETDIPVYVADCIIWETMSAVSHRVYWLGKTGSRTVDSAVQSVEWYHQSAIGSSPAVAGAAESLTQQGIDFLRNRLEYTRNQKETLETRRKELASYARKLIWLETISMLDSKAAGNCLPGTIQFCKTLGVPITNNWTDTRIDARTLLRAWKKHDYGVNRLLLPAIDAACNRVKKELLSVTAYYVPSVVK